MRSQTSERILVVGAGIAGLGTARALARAGFAAEDVEPQRTCQEAGAGIYLPINAARALRASLAGGHPRVVRRRRPVRRRAARRPPALRSVPGGRLWRHLGTRLAQRHMWMYRFNRLGVLETFGVADAFRP